MGELKVHFVHGLKILVGGGTREVLVIKIKKRVFMEERISPLLTVIFHFPLTVKS